jgi:parvulin-like peptidyl-prolyl isomerase
MVGRILKQQGLNAMTQRLTIGGRIFEHHELLPLMDGYGMVPQLVREVLVDQAIAAWEDLGTGNLDPEAEAVFVQQFLEQRQLTSDAARQAWSQQNHRPTQDLDRLAGRQYKLEAYKNATWGHKAESHFLQRKTRLDRVIYSLLRVKDAAVAQELYFRLQSGEDSFSNLAGQYSQGPEANTGGLIGPIDVGSCHPQLGQMLSISKPDQLWPPTRVEDWWLVARLEKFLPAQLDEPMRRRLVDELFNTWVQEQVQAHLESSAAPTLTPVGS